MRRKSSRLSRRAFLRGTGKIAIALPVADFMMRDGRVAAAEAPEAIKRLVTISVSNGFPDEFWTFEQALSPLSLPALKSKITAFRSLSNPSSANPDHVQGSGSLFVGAPPVRGAQDTATAKAGGISLDQFFAQQVGGKTPVRSIVFGLWHTNERRLIEMRRSFDGQGIPLTPFFSPYDVFRALFGGLGQGVSPAEAERLKSLELSLLDSVVEDFKSVMGERHNLPQAAKARLSDHLDHVRELEKKAASTQTELACSLPAQPQPLNLSVDAVPYESWANLMMQMFDLLALAFNCDITRSASVMIGASGENFAAAGVNTAAEHPLAHTKGLPQFTGEFLTNRRHKMQLIRRLLNGLNNVAVADKTLLDHTAVVCATEFNIGGNSATDVHQSQFQHHWVAGAGMGKGEVLNLGAQRTTNDLYRTVLKALGIDVPSFGVAAHNKGLIAQVTPP